MHGEAPEPMGRRKAPDMTLPQLDVRTDEIAHWPVHRADGPCCFHCVTKTRLGCSKCKKGLCLTEGRNCYIDFHKTRSEKLILPQKLTILVLLFMQST